MEKISKSKKLDKAQENADRQKLNDIQSTLPKHWEPGSLVIFEGRSYVLASILDERVTLVGSGEVRTIINPYFIQWGTPWANYS